MLYVLCLVLFVLVRCFVYSSWVMVMGAENRRPMTKKSGLSLGCVGVCVCVFCFPFGGERWGRFQWNFMNIKLCREPLLLVIYTMEAMVFFFALVINLKMDWSSLDVFRLLPVLLKFLSFWRNAMPSLRQETRPFLPEQGEKSSRIRPLSRKAGTHQDEIEGEIYFSLSGL